MIQDVFILGATGKVGRTLVSQIFQKGDTNPNIHRNPTRIVGLASSKKVVFNSSGLENRLAERFVHRQEEGDFYENMQDFLSLSKNPDLVFIDVTDGKGSMLQFHLNARRLDYGIVTANKNPLVDCSFESFNVLTKDPRKYRYRCSVMAGAEAIDKIRDLRDLGDLPTEISGCFSGTLGYLTSELEKGRKLSEIVLEARNLGYTEPNPADDLSGLDVARKILILARTAGYDVQGKDFHLEPFVSEQNLASNSISQFIENLRNLDEEFKEKVEKANESGNVLRYLTTFTLNNSHPSIDVGLKEVPINSPLGSLQGTRNKIVIKTNTYTPNFYCVEAPGAGLEITAQNIRRDLLYQIYNRIVCQ